MGYNTGTRLGDKTRTERVQVRVHLQPSVLGNKVTVQITESMLAMWYQYMFQSVRFTWILLIHTRNKNTNSTQKCY
jgi:hypothetical protein